MRTQPTIDTSDEDMGRGRNNDSSSSRETSPRPGRSFSPVSEDDDDDDIPVPSNSNNQPSDTAPPERPLLRQPVAFAAATTLNTYQADISAPTTSGAFLPGQGVVIPRKRKSKPTTAPRKRKQNDYGGQTSRFRLKPPDFSASVDSRYERAFPDSSSTTVSTGHSTLSHDADRGSTIQASNPEFVAGSSKGFRFTEKKTTTTSNKSQPMMTKWSVTNQSDEASRMATTASGSKQALHSPQAAPVAYGAPSAAFGRSDFLRSGPRSHSRRDSSFYDSGMAHTLELNPYRGYLSMGSHPMNSPPLPPDATRLAAPSYVSHRSTVGRKSSPEFRRQREQPLVMLTLLIQDIRSGVTDNQLAELRLPMRSAANPNGGFWVDAGLLGQQLQSSASRIDGPAKAYTLRGKYRQFFLRVTAEGVDEFISTDLAVRPDQILDVVVEELLPPGQLPLPPRIPRGLVDSPRPESSRSPTPERDSYPQQPPKAFKEYPAIPYRETSSESRQHNRSRGLRQFDGSNRPMESTFRRSYTASLSSSSLSSTENWRSKKATYKQQTEFGNRSRSPSLRRSESPEPAVTAPDSARSTVSESRLDSSSPKEISDEVHRLVSEAIGEIVKEEPGWTRFLKARAGLEPHRVSDIIAQYRFVKGIIDKLSGQRAPLLSHDVKINHSHIARALKIDDPFFTSDCIETLALLDLYGPSGRHCEDLRVVELVNDTNRPAHDTNPIKPLLQLLQDKDKQWKENHPIDATSSGTGTQIINHHIKLG